MLFMVAAFVIAGVLRLIPCVALQLQGTLMIVPGTPASTSVAAPVTGKSNQKVGQETRGISMLYLKGLVSDIIGIRIQH